MLYCHDRTGSLAAMKYPSDQPVFIVLYAGQGICSSDGFPGLHPIPDNEPHDDVCAVCGEEGNLLCCDFCPRTHHLDCLVPPMQSLPKVSMYSTCTCSSKIWSGVGILTFSSYPRPVQLPALSDLQHTFSGFFFLLISCYRSAPHFFTRSLVRPSTFEGRFSLPPIPRVGIDPVHSLQLPLLARSS